MSLQSLIQRLETEIFLGDIVGFLVGSWKVIIIAAVICFLGAVGCIAIIPNKYKATTQIEIIRISINNYNNNYLGSNIEGPNLLIPTTGLPSGYDRFSLSKVNIW